MFIDPPLRHTIDHQRQLYENSADTKLTPKMIMQFSAALSHQSKTALPALAVLFLTLSGAFARDRLDNIKDNSELTKELKDVYRAFRINNIITEQQEWINIYQDEDAAGLKKLLTGFIKTCDSLKQCNFYNETLNSFVKRYLTLTIQSYDILQSKGLSSNAFKKDFEKYKAEQGKYMNYLYATYATNHFVNMTEDAYWKANDKNNYIRSKDYSRYQKLKTANLKAGLMLLDSIIKQTSNFQKYTVYQIESADQYEKYRDSLEEDATAIAIAKYKSILDQGHYSIYLFEAWLKWRSVTQQNLYGVSKMSDIPNGEYDKIREQVALTILTFIVENPKDEMAINEFLLMATHCIVKRFGDYPYGNQNTLEYHQIFDNIK